PVWRALPARSSARISSQDPVHHLLFHLPDPEPPCVIHVRPQTPAAPRDLGFGILSHYCGPELIDRVLAQHGRAEQRCRLLPARLVVNAILLMCLKPTVSYQKLMYQLNAAVPASQSWTAPSRSAFAQARQRLGWEVMESLFRAQAMPLAGPAMGCC